MASFAIHLAVAKVYLNHYPIHNEEEFMKGVVAPDLVKDKSKSHYSDPTLNNSLKEIMLKKVNLKKYLLTNRMNTDYQKGYFLHLFTDYEFFTNFFDEDMVEDMSYDEFFKDLYYSYECTNKEMEEKYPVHLYSLKGKLEDDIYMRMKKKRYDNFESCLDILPVDKLENWIDTIGQIHLEDKAYEILTNR